MCHVPHVTRLQTPDLEPKTVCLKSHRGPRVESLSPRGRHPHHRPRVERDPARGRFITIQNCKGPRAESFSARGRYLLKEVLTDLELKTIQLEVNRSISIHKDRGPRAERFQLEVDPLFFLWFHKAPGPRASYDSTSS
ncbi:hypothetical protein PGTUg99_015904 [Puccinia graminis f. sp. tritici]|uniref:Uncharacterized protein n=1 Tax=Puccinia graminis f. sp. tritici TaxID=56615 RepID=A0A5B0SA75_PUCGR|nr:hypothetical protein PGTUg99_015904 [Puccinia graminis f. sp. tritici]